MYFSMRFCVSPSTPMSLNSVKSWDGTAGAANGFNPAQTLGDAPKASSPSPKFLLSASALALCNWPPPHTKCQRNFSMGHSQWHRAVSESFPAHIFTPQSSTISQFGHKANIKPFCLLSPSSFFFPTFQFISSPTTAFAGLFHQVNH